MYELRIQMARERFRKAKVRFDAATKLAMAGSASRQEIDAALAEVRTARTWLQFLLDLVESETALK